MRFPPSPETPVRLVHLGDSYTCGEGVPESRAWPTLLHKGIEREGFIVESTQVIARTGWTSRDLLKKLEEMPSGPGPCDYVTLCIGVNNQYRGHAVALFEQDLLQLIRIAGSWLCEPMKGLLLLSIPDWGASPFAQDRDTDAISREIDTFNAGAAIIAQQARIPFFDWTPLSREFFGRAGAFAADGLHPSTMQHRAWSNALLPVFLGESAPADLK